MTGDTRHGTEDQTLAFGYVSHIYSFLDYRHGKAILGTKLPSLTQARIHFSRRITDVDKPCYISHGGFNVKALSSRAPLLDRDRDSGEGEYLSVNCPRPQLDHAFSIATADIIDSACGDPSIQHRVLQYVPLMLQSARRPLQAASDYDWRANVYKTAGIDDLSSTPTRFHS
ncbi:hypothetical protein ARMGADRAFT_1169197, partial [Armillaria gallica]